MLEALTITSSHQLPYCAATTDTHAAGRQPLSPERLRDRPWTAAGAPPAMTREPAYLFDMDGTLPTVAQASESVRG